VTATIRIGFIGLIDCAIPVVAQEKGFAEKHGLELELIREASWAAIRDKLAYGVFDAAHILAGIPLASSLGLSGGPPVPMIAPMALGYGGNAITVSLDLFHQMCKLDPVAMEGKRAQAAQVFAKLVAKRRAADQPPLSLATVFPFSSHNYELRYWLASAGLDPDEDVRIGVVAPPRMSEHLRAGWIDGYCVGEPWNLRAVQRDHGVIITTKSDIWPAAPEKVLGMRADWAEENAETVANLVRAFVEAAQWADDMANRAELAAILADETYLGAPVNLLRAALMGHPVLRPDAPPSHEPDRHVFYRWQATFPWVSHGIWLLTQMRRWNQIKSDIDYADLAAKVFRPDLYRTAVSPIGIPVPRDDGFVAGEHDEPYSIPAANGGSVELGPDRFMDDRVFDPSAPQAYLDSFKIK
jgi:NitT/TauT family transport system ATP-binding protein/nitrate/nitrite transport system substrate-binding protein